MQFQSNFRSVLNSVQFQSNFRAVLEPSAIGSRFRAVLEQFRSDLSATSEQWSPQGGVARFKLKNYHQYQWHGRRLIDRARLCNVAITKIG